MAGFTFGLCLYYQSPLFTTLPSVKAMACNEETDVIEGHTIDILNLGSQIDIADYIQNMD